MLGFESFFLMLKSENTSKASWTTELGESSMTGISTRYRGCFCFFNFLLGKGTVLLRYLCKVAARQVLAWEMASSLDEGGEDREKELDSGLEAQGPLLDLSRNGGKARISRPRRPLVPR
jgi:hypothetical protein